MGQRDRLQRQVALSRYLRERIADGEPIDLQKVFDASATDISEFKSRPRRGIAGPGGVGQPPRVERDPGDRERPEGREESVVASGGDDAGGLSEGGGI